MRNLFHVAVSYWLPTKHSSLFKTVAILTSVECEWPEFSVILKKDAAVVIILIAKVAPDDSVSDLLNNCRHRPTPQVATFGTNIDASSVVWKICWLKQQKRFTAI